ncbi:MAG TPA: hypothetical protein VHJ37_11445 [Thermoleophilaceae bacterium]|nr:hypothetical protein [Thermoleophilaceae bacterium]
MLLFLVTQQVPLILLLALLILCYLTAIELRNEDEPFLIKAWWVLLVFLTNVVGYAAFRIWLAAYRRRRSA